VIVDPTNIEQVVPVHIILVLSVLLLNSVYKAVDTKKEQHGASSTSGQLSAVVLLAKHVSFAAPADKCFDERNLGNTS